MSQSTGEPSASLRDSVALAELVQTALDPAGVLSPGRGF